MRRRPGGQPGRRGQSVPQGSAPQTEGSSRVLFVHGPRGLGTDDAARRPGRRRGCRGCNLDPSRHPASATTWWRHPGRASPTSSRSPATTRPPMATTDSCCFQRNATRRPRPRPDLSDTCRRGLAEPKTVRWVPRPQVSNMVSRSPQPKSPRGPAHRRQDRAFDHAQRRHAKDRYAYITRARSASAGWTRSAGLCAFSLTLSIT